MSKILENLKDLKTTIPAIILFLMALPNLEIVQQILGFLPGSFAARITVYITGIAAIASGIGLIFGIKAAKKA